MTNTRTMFEKVVVNAGVGRASSGAQFEEKVLPQILRDIAALTGQQPQVRKARRSVAGFKVREGQIVGIKVTLRRQRMVDFLERIVRIVLPRVKDFAGLDAQSIDDGGTLHVGFKEQFVFPEIDSEGSAVIFSLGLNIVPRVKDRVKAVAAYEAMGIPFKRPGNSDKKRGRRS